MTPDTIETLSKINTIDLMYLIILAILLSVLAAVVGVIISNFLWRKIGDFEEHLECKKYRWRYKKAKEKRENQ